MDRRSLLAASSCVVLSGCLNSSEDGSKPTETDGDDDSRFDSDPLSLIPPRAELPLIDDRWGVDNVRIDQHPSHTRRFTAPDRRVTITVWVFDSVTEATSFVLQQRWLHDGDVSLKSHGIGSGGHYFESAETAQILFRDANAIARITFTDESSSLLDGVLSDGNIDRTFDIAVAIHETWR